MEESFDEMEFKSLVNPSPVYKNTKAKHKPPTKLALKRTLRRSSMYDKLIPSVENSKINMVDIQSTETSSYSSSVQSSTKPVKPRRGFIILNETHSSLLAKNSDKLSIDDSSCLKDKVECNDVEIIPSTDDEAEVIPATADNSIIDSSQGTQNVKQVLTVNNLKQNDLLSRTKYESIQNWVESVEPINTQKSAKYGDTSQETSGAINSTFALDRTCVPFDKWMKAAYSSDKIKDKQNKHTRNKLKENNPPETDTPNQLLKKYLGSQDVQDILQETSDDKVIYKITDKKLDNIDVNINVKENIRNIQNLGRKALKKTGEVKSSVGFKTPAKSFPKTPSAKKKDTIKTSDNQVSNADDVFITPAKQMMNNNNDDVSKLLDNLYGNSWHKNKDQIFTEPRQTKKTQISKLREPHTEKKIQKEPLYRNPYLDSEKEKASSLLKSLQKQRIQGNLVSPFFARSKIVDDDTPSPPCDNRKNTNTVQHAKKTHHKSRDDSFSSEVSDLDVSLESRLKKKHLAKPTQLKFDDDTDPKFAIQSATKKTRRRIVHISESDSDCEAPRNTIKSSSRTSKTSVSDHSESNDREQRKDSKTDDLVDQIQNITIQDTSSESVFIVDSDSDDAIIRKPKTKQPQKSSNLQRLQSHTFLSSLSKNIPIEQCDPAALIFKSNYKKYRDELTQKLFTLFNERIFDKCLAEDTPFVWSVRMTHTAGLCRCMKKTHRDGKITRSVQIQLSTKVLDSADRLRDTLVHELCHAATYVVNEVSDGHGPLWKAWARRAMRAFPELPPIERCHNYAINYKYTYKCTSCGYSFGRHSKSLDCERKRCGYCHGSFEVMLNKMKQGGKESVPCTPKKGATGFALFVKENYALHKSPGVSHQALMKLLGKKYAESKK